MDVFEPELALRKKLAVETSKPRPPLVPAEKNNVNTTHRPRMKEVTSRYKSPTPSTASGARRCPSTASGVRRCPSPDIKRNAPPSSSQLVPKRAQSVERRRPSTPPSPSPSSPSTPVKDSSVNKHLASKRVAGGRLPEGLWPSTMRNLCVSFQSDSNSIPVCKKEKPVTSSSDRTLRPSSNVAHKHVETPSVLRKPTPERKRSPLKGKNAPDQSENSKPVDSSQARLIDQHRWPSRAGGKVSSNSLTKSMDLADKTGRTTIQLPAIGLSSLRRASLPDSIGRPLKKSESEALRLLSLEESGKAVLERTLAVDDSFQTSFSRKLLSLSSSDRLMVTNPAVRSPSLPSNGSRPPSPCKASRGVSPSPTRPSTPPSRGVSPSRIRPSTPPSRGVSPSRIRPSTPPSRGISPSRIRPGSSCQSNNPDSVLSFIADIKKGKKGANYIEDTHQLRLLYNRYLQWRFANARAESLLHVQKVTSETTLFNVWHETLSLWDSVIRKRIDLQQQKLELKLKSVFNDQLAYLDDWALLEKHHIAALSGAVEDLEANTLRLPVTGRARTDIDSLKIAICSAVDVMQAMASSTCSLLPRVEGMGSLVSELAVIAAREKAMLDECEALLASIAAMQVEECSHRTHLLQTKQALEMLSRNFWQSRHVHNL